VQKRKRPEAPSEVTLPITPMLDMAFQLMFFFLATFNPISASEGEVDLSLPAKSEPAAQDVKRAEPTKEVHKEEVDDNPELTISLVGYGDPHNKGLVSEVSVTTTEGKRSLKGTPDERDASLREQLAKALPTGETKEGKKKTATARIEAEGDVRWSQVMKYVDIARKEGYQVSFARPIQGSR